MTRFTLQAIPALDRLSASARAILDGPGQERLFTSRAWFETFVEAGLADGAVPLFYVLADETGRAHALLPCQKVGGEAGLGDPTIASLTSFYSCDFQPLIAADADRPATALALGRCLARELAREPVVRIDTLDTTLPTLAPFLAGLARPGRLLLRYEHFGRWSEDLAGASFQDYLGRRDGALREVVRRKGNRLERAGGAFEMIDGAGVERGIAAYEAVYARSWKEPEPFPLFQPVLMRALARAGWLRLALCHIEGRPIAAQLWTVVGGRATVLKLAHDGEQDRLSPGTLLTAFAIRTLIERDGISSLDFGRGDDPYKRAWTRHRTPHIGILWTSVARRPALAVRHVLGGLLRRRRGGPAEMQEGAEPGQ